MAKKHEILIMKNGDKLPILKKSGKYIYVKGSQFRRRNPNILKIEKITVEEPIQTEETVTEEELQAE